MGGIKPTTPQAGASTTSRNRAVSLEPALRVATKNLRAVLCSSDSPLVWRPSFTSDGLSDLLGVERGHIAGMRPDGGVWFERGSDKPLVIAEAKKQGAGGNAIERWYKNYAVARALDCTIYVSLCSGEGFFNSLRSQSALELALALDPQESHRLEHGSVWNRPLGRIWMYRWPEASAAPASVLEPVIISAIKHARAARRTGTHPGAASKRRSLGAAP
jgi:hypothetical protein